MGEISEKRRLELRKEAREMAKKEINAFRRKHLGLETIVIISLGGGAALYFLENGLLIIAFIITAPLLVWAKNVEDKNLEKCEEEIYEDLLLKELKKK